MVVTAIGSSKFSSDSPMKKNFLKPLIDRQKINTTTIP
jgi:hypothetical protein